MPEADLLPRNARRPRERSASPTHAPPGPLFVLLAPFLAGIWAGTHTSISLSILLGLMASLSVGLLLAHVRDHRVFFLVAAVAGTFLGGMSRTRLVQEPEPDHVRKLAGGTVIEAVGELASVERRQRTTPSGQRIPWSRATLEVRRVRINHENHPADGRLRLYTFRRLPAYDPGDDIHVEGRLRKPPVRQNPGSQDWTWSRQQNGLGGSLIVDVRNDWRYVRSPPFSFSGLLARTRSWLNERLGTPSSFRLLPALLLGRRSAVSKDLERTFQNSGVIHFLAVSGLHVAFLVGASFLLLRLFRCSPGTTRLVLPLVLFLYVALTGFRIPTVRAAVMVGVLVIGLLSRWSVGSLHLLGLAAWILLLYRPYDLYSPGFQFSFLAVGGLVLLSEPFGLDVAFPEDSAKKRLLREFLWVERVKKRLRSGAAYVLSVIRVTLIALLVVGPLTLLHFHLIAPGALLGNPLFFLLVPVLLGFGALYMAFAVLGALGLPGSGLLTGLTAPLLHGLEYLTIGASSLIASLPGSHLYLPAPPLAGVWLYYAGLLLFWWFHRRLPGPEALKCGLPVLALIVLACSGMFVRGERRPGASLTMLDVGHGGSFMLKDAGGHHVLYDCGATGYSNPGTWTTAPALWKRGRVNVELLILSHPDLDHISGVRALVERFDVHRIWVPPGFDSFPGGSALLRDLRDMNASIEVVSAGTTDRVGSIRLQVHAPPEPDLRSGRPTGPDWSSNAISLVVEARTAGRSVLFTGDLEQRGKRHFKRTTPTGNRPDVLQVPHHGGSGSAANPLTDVLSPRYALISTTSDTLSKQTVRHYRHTGARVLSTSDHGAIRLRWRGATDRLHAEHWKKNGWAPVPDRPRKPVPPGSDDSF